MDIALEQRLAQGMQLIAELPDLAEDQVSSQMRKVYAGIQGTLRVPFVNFIFRTLANYPDSFEPAWNGLSGNLRRLECERAADRLRGVAAENIQVAPLSGVSDEDRAAVSAFNDAIHYVLPKLLLTATALDMQWSGRFAARPQPSQDKVALIPYGPARGAGKLPLVDPESADPELRKLLQDIQQKHQHPGVASYYRGLANTPAFLDQTWRAVRTHVGSESYGQRKQSLLALAETLAAEHLVTKLTTPRAPGPEPVAAILAVFRYRLIPDLLLDVTLITAMLNYPQAGGQSRFSVAAQ